MHIAVLKLYVPAKKAISVAICIHGQLHGISIQVYPYIQTTHKQIGVDFALKVLNWDTDTLIRLQLWDIAGE